MKYLYAVIFYSIFFSSSCTSNGGIDEGDTQAVLDHHWETFVRNDLEGVMEDYTEESVLITPNATYSGLEEIRQNFINAFKTFPKESAKLTLHQKTVVQDVGYILWEAEVPEFKLSYATDTFFIRNGKITRQTYAGVRESK